MSDTHWVAWAMSPSPMAHEGCLRRFTWDIQPDGSQLGRSWMIFTKSRKMPQKETMK